MHLKDTWLPTLAIIAGWGLHASFHTDPPPGPEPRILPAAKPARVTPMRLTRALAAEPSPLQQVKSLDALRRALAEGHQPFAKLLAVADTFTAPHLRRTARLLVLRAWLQHDPDDAWNHAVTLNEPAPHSFLRDIIDVWSEFAPAEAADALVKLPRKTADPLRDRMLQTLARRDPTAAHALWRELDPQANTHEISETIFKQLATVNVQDALAKVEELPMKRRGYAEAAVVSEWAKRDPDAALDWFATHPRIPTGAFNASSTLADALLKKPPNEMLEAVSAIQARAFKRNLINSLTSRWLGKDLNGAVDYAFSPGADRDLRSKLAEEGLSPLLRNGEVERAVSLLDFVPKNSQEVLTRTITGLLHSNPTPVSLKAAERAALSITDESIRIETLESIDAAKADYLSTFPFEAKELR